MESQSFEKNKLIAEILNQLSESCDYIIEWNKNISSPDEYLISSSGMQTLAASCMLIEAVGEGIKNIDKRDPGFLEAKAAEINWRGFVGIRNKIAHGYFDINEDIVFDVVKNDIPELKNSLEKLLKIIEL